MKKIIQKMSIRWQILFPVLITVLLLFSSLVYTIVKMSSEMQEVEVASQKAIFNGAVIADISIGVFKIQSIAHKIDSDPEDIVRDIAAEHSKLQGLIANTKKEKEIAVGVFLADFVGSLNLDGIKGIRDEDRKYLSRYYDSILSLNQSIEDLFVFYEEQAIKDATKRSDARSDNKGTGFLIIAILILISTILPHVVAKIICEPIRNLQDMAKKVANGDLSARVCVSGNNELTHLEKDMNYTVSSIEEMVGSLISIGNNVAAASTELSSVMTQSESNATEEKSQIDLIASSVNELSSVAQNVAKNAANADSSAREVMALSNIGSDAFEKCYAASEDMSVSLTETAKTVNHLANESEEIGNVVRVIEDISGQTNLLALNAAIEAARAGDQGRGFAVVADEVRTLACRTQKSTEEIQNIIESLQSRAKQANKSMIESLSQLSENRDMMAEATKAIHSITDAVSNISDINSEVATAAEQQSCVTESVNGRVVSIIDIVNQNVSGINQSASTAIELSSLAETQREQLSFFK